MSESFTVRRLPLALASMSGDGRLWGQSHLQHFIKWHAEQWPFDSLRLRHRAFLTLFFSSLARTHVALAFIRCPLRVYRMSTALSRHNKIAAKKLSKPFLARRRIADEGLRPRAFR